MIDRKSMSPEEIIKLLSRLKSETPDYPVDQLAARKAAFLEKAINLPITD